MFSTYWIFKIISHFYSIGKYFKSFLNLTYTYYNHKLKKCQKKVGAGRNFERPNVERPILQNSKIANIKSFERSSYSIF